MVSCNFVSSLPLKNRVARVANEISYFGRLKANYDESGERVACGSLIEQARKRWPDASVRRIGACIRKAFPKSKRIRSNSVYYYENLANKTNPVANSQRQTIVQSKSSTLSGVDVAIQCDIHVRVSRVQQNENAAAGR